MLCVQSSWVYKGNLALARLLSLDLIGDCPAPGQETSDSAPELKRIVAKKAFECIGQINLSLYISRKPSQIHCLQRIQRLAALMRGPYDANFTVFRATMQTS